ncbi:hypothetical protein NKR23_g5574 [Pleurostoma richardsiae]|uniref:Uncharacterized protein n=1 Tax=Pleurostoma richardsiae TaxID=41990 RepID=A0AA38RRZ9_9PEZI|nr:hypothetical protein NKR23_g5574 [Pleurostoma richardsiae]
MDPKARVALGMIREKPQLWFRGSPLDDRDAALLAAPTLPWLEYGRSSYLRKIYYKQRDSDWGTLDWKVENDVRCKYLVSVAGAKNIGINLRAESLLPFVCMTINVNIKANPGHGFDWGFLSTSGVHPGNVRIFRGPPETCSIHPWDAIILRNCAINMSSMVNSVASGRWDILLMKMCEDCDLFMLFGLSRNFP